MADGVRWKKVEGKSKGNGKRRPVLARLSYVSFGNVLVRARIAECLQIK